MTRFNGTPRSLEEAQAIIGVVVVSLSHKFHPDRTTPSIESVIRSEIHIYHSDAILILPDISTGTHQTSRYLVRGTILFIIYCVQLPR